MVTVLELWLKLTHACHSLSLVVVCLSSTGVKLYLYESFFYQYISLDYRIEVTVA